MPKTLEILVATMNRKDLGFLSAMFGHIQIDDYLVLIINQCTEQSSLTSNKSNIRVINTLGYGLSKSRNTAIKNATGDICLIADDDIIFLPNLKEKILKTYQNKQPSIAIFRYLNAENKPLRRYDKLSYRINPAQNYIDAASVEISFNRKFVVQNKCYFDESFGLGAKYPMGEEAIFIFQALKKGGKVTSEKKVIGIHPHQSQTARYSLDNKINILALIYKKTVPTFYKLYLAKSVFHFLKKENKLNWKRFKTLYSIGLGSVKAEKD